MNTNPETTHEFTLFAVDDAEVTRLIIKGAFSAEFNLETFENAEDCMRRLHEHVPDLMLLDVGLPGVDGYTLCKILKRRAQFAGIPVIFVSARDDIESRLAGYDAGGIDFIVKPFKVEELGQKIRLALADARKRSALAQQMAESEMLTSLVMANLDEYALLIRFLRELNACETPRQVAAALFAMLANFKLDSAVQLRVGGNEDTLSSGGESGPLEVSVIHHVRDMGRIFEFKDRAAFNFPHTTVLINNMPVDDADLCGRLRDHLAIAVESANGRLEALQARADKVRTADSVGKLLASLEVTVADFSARYDKARYQGTTLTQAMADELAAAFAHLGLSGEQEDRILDIVRSRAFDLVDLYDFGDDTQAALNQIQGQLRTVAYS